MVECSMSGRMKCLVSALKKLQKIHIGMENIDYLNVKNTWMYEKNRENNCLYWFCFMFYFLATNSSFWTKLKYALAWFKPEVQSFPLYIDDKCNGFDNTLTYIILPYRTKIYPNVQNNSHKKISSCFRKFLLLFYIKFMLLCECKCENWKLNNYKSFMNGNCMYET